MTENQKLREALQHAIEDLSSATGFLTRRSRDRQSKTVAALAKLQADIIALPTAKQVDDINVAESFTSVTKTEQEVGLTDEERADMACAVAAICTGTSSRTIAATAIDWTERALRAKGGK